MYTSQIQEAFGKKKSVYIQNTHLKELYGLRRVLFVYKSGNCVKHCFIPVNRGSLKVHRHYSSVKVSKRKCSIYSQPICCTAVTFNQYLYLVS